MPISPIRGCKGDAMTRYTTTYYIYKSYTNGTKKDSLMNVTEDKEIAMARVKAFRTADPSFKSKGYDYILKEVKEKKIRVR